MLQKNYATLACIKFACIKFATLQKMELAYFPGNFMNIFSSNFSEYLQASASGNGIEPVNLFEKLSNVEQSSLTAFSVDCK